MLIALLCLLLGALLLSSCSNTTNTPTNDSSSGTATPSISQTMQNEGKAQLQTFQQWISLMQQYGGDVTTYQQQYSSDQQALASASTAESYNKALATLQGHVQAIKIPALKQEGKSLQQELNQQVSSWGQQHTFKDTYNGKTYSEGYQYDNNTGIGGPLWLQQELSSEKTLDDYQQTVEDLNMWLFDFQQMKANASDKTPYDQPHKSDQALMKQFGHTTGPVLIVSLSEEAMRAYNNGKLVKAFLVTTGQPDLPTPPGTWWIEGKKHPTTFKSDEPKGSPNWYPDTKINYAMQYHSNGYFIHDAWWRTQFGPGSNYPYQDPDGDPFAGQGSHGCVNMSTSDSAWVYGFVSLFTPLIIY